MIFATLIAPTKMAFEVTSTNEEERNSLHECAQGIFHSFSELYAHVQTLATLSVPPVEINVRALVKVTSNATS